MPEENPENVSTVIPRHFNRVILFSSFVKKKQKKAPDFEILQAKTGEFHKAPPEEGHLNKHSNQKHGNKNSPAKAGLLERLCNQALAS